MEKIYSKIKPGKLLHGIVRRSDFLPGRQDLIDPDNFLQCALLNLNKGKTFKPHMHLWQDEISSTCGDGECHDFKIAQESWVVVKGWVKVFYYDIDKTLIREEVIGAGDASFTLEGGHNYEILEDDTRVMEFKTGPYKGQEKDKVFI